MARAWELMRERYNFPRVPFRSIGRACFADCLKAAWNEAREIVRLAGRGVEALRAAIVAVQTPPHRVGLSTSRREDGAAMVQRLWQVRVMTAAMELAAA
ncbi:hypothetical protein [Methylobacterium gnaphalii]|nr:hypothetical protein [Methylobacterium gnaphalii]